MNTTTAATEANVTVATIRTWCRIGAVAAAKVAGRWVIDTTSLAARIAIGKRKAPMANTPDLKATYTVQLPGDQAPRTIAPVVKRRTSADGENLITVKGLAPLLAEKIDAITDEGDRLHTLTVLGSSQIVLSDQAHDDWNRPAAGVHARKGGQIRTTYTGTSSLSLDVVLDLGEKLAKTL